MVRTGKKVTSNVSYISSLIIGAGIGSLVTLILSGVAAAMMLNGVIQESAVGMTVMGVILVSVATAALVSACMLKRRWMLVCIGAGALYFLLLLASTALFFGGEYQGFFVTAALCVGGSGAIGLLGLKGQGGGKRKMKKLHFR